MLRDVVGEVADLVREVRSPRLVDDRNVVQVLRQPLVVVGALAICSAVDERRLREEAAREIERLRRVLEISDRGGPLSEPSGDRLSES